MHVVSPDPAMVPVVKAVVVVVAEVVAQELALASAQVEALERQPELARALMAVLLAE